MGIFGREWRFLVELAALGLVIWIQLRLRRWLLECEFARRWPALLRVERIVTILLIVWVAVGFLGSIPVLYFRIPASWAMSWLRGTALTWSLASLGGFLVLAAWRRVPRFSGARRGFVRAIGSAALAAPFAGMGYGIFVERFDLRLRQVDVPMPGLPKDLDGLRLVQLSDIHLSPFLSERELARAVDMANEHRAHIALVTGDLITGHGDPLDACLKQLARLRAEAGVLGCLGNHEIYAHTQAETTQKGARLGMDFLRQRARQLRFGNATLNVVGVDYQRMGSRYLAGTEKLVVPGVTNVLLSHNPNAFPAAVRKGFELMIAGHTHGGQVTVEILHQTLNFARFYTRYIYGLYREGRAALWVTRGIGTVGVPARVGAPPEVAAIRLCAS
jgi:predicted MPP superfamily phosphohydrolase